MAFVFLVGIKYSKSLKATGQYCASKEMLHCICTRQHDRLLSYRKYGGECHPIWNCTDMHCGKRMTIYTLQVSNAVVQLSISWLTRVIWPVGKHDVTD